MSEKIMKSITLYFQDDRSDKVYQAAINPVANGYTVTFAYGRRGATLKVGTKTKEPVPLAKAESIYHKLVDSKIKKGYEAGDTGTIFTDSTKPKEHSGIHLQLLNSITLDEVERLCQDKNYCAQEKYDGERRAIKREKHVINGINKKGLFTSLADPISQHGLQIKSDNFVVDGEAINNTLFAFDLLECDGQDLRDMPYEERYRRLQSLIVGYDAIVVVETAFTVEEKIALFKKINDTEREGVVFKRIDAVHSAGRPNSGGDQLKYKFYATCSAIVSKHNEGKRSVAITALDDGWCVPLGSVTIPSNKEIPPVNAIVEVQFLYAYPTSHKLAQPVYLNERTDVEPHECTLKQLKYKPELAVA